MKKIIAMLLAVAMMFALVACGGNTTTETTAAPAAENKTETPEAVTIKVAAIETAYGSEVWQKVTDAFTETTGIKVELTTDKNLEDILTGPMQNGEFPTLCTWLPAATPA